MLSGQIGKLIISQTARPFVSRTTLGLTSRKRGLSHREFRDEGSQAMPFEIAVPTTEGPTQLSVEPGSALIFVGANGGGKSRLAVHIEESLGLRAHRISAHRALALNPAVPKISERAALFGLRTGYADKRAELAHRQGHRWQGNVAVALLNDFDHLVQALFADQTNESLKTHRRVRAGDVSAAEPTKFEQLVEIWERVLPDRKLHISGDDIQVALPGSSERYVASEMSDGERAVFYLIGQTLTAADDSLLIVDEPELHVHRSIMGKLWDELESLRQDCAFVFITHDLEFAGSRVAQKYVLREYRPAPTWVVEAVPDDTGFDEQITTLILGSRRPVLFVEGTDGSLDIAVYRCSFPEWTVIPRGSCEEVIHSVVTMRRNQQLTRVTCSGIVDADDYQPDDVMYLARLGVAVLPVSEIENVILLPEVCRAIAGSEGYDDHDIDLRLGALKRAIFATLDTYAAIDTVVTRYCRRRIDRLLKRIDLSSADNVSDIASEFDRQIAALDITSIAKAATERIRLAIADDSLPALLANYDNPGLLALAASHLKGTRLGNFEAWLTRVLRNGTVPALSQAIRESLPEVQAQ